MNTIAILHDIRSAHNVGSIFRTADGAGVSKIYLTGYTPAPIDRFGRVQKEILKTSLGATSSVAWEACDEAEPLLEKLKKGGFTIVAVEQTNRSLNYEEYVRKEKTVYIFGNEIDGVPEELLTLADSIIEIPMHGEKESLNVSVTAGIILFHNQTPTSAR